MPEGKVILSSVDAVAPKLYQEAMSTSLLPGIESATVHGYFLHGFIVRLRSAGLLNFRVGVIYCRENVLDVGACIVRAACHPRMVGYQWAHTRRTPGIRQYKQARLRGTSFRINWNGGFRKADGCRL